MYDKNLEEKIASVLFYNQDFLKAGIVKAEDFYSDIKPYVQKMINLSDGDCIIDVNTMGKSFEVPSQEMIENFDKYLLSLRKINLDRYIQALPRKLGQIATSSINPEEKLLRFQSEIEKLAFNNHNIEDYHVKNHIDGYIEQLFNPDSSKGYLISTGIKELDAGLWGGFERNDSIVIAGDTGNYKSTLMYNIALFNALIGKRVIIYSYEIIMDKMFDIFTSMLVGLDSVFLKSRNLDNIDSKYTDEIRALVPSILKNIELYVYDGNSTLSDIKINSMSRKPDLILIDYLQLMPSVDENDFKSLAKMTKEIKNLTKPDRLNCPIITLSQFNRAKDDEDQENRKLRHLHGSSTIEKDADIIIFTKKIKQNEIKITVAKNRSGSTGEFKLPVKPDIHTIGDVRIIKKSEEFLQGEKK